MYNNIAFKETSYKQNCIVYKGVHVVMY